MYVRRSRRKSRHNRAEVGMAHGVILYAKHSEETLPSYFNATFG